MPNPNEAGQICPECHVGNLVVKSGRFGNFTACSNFPKCKFIVKKAPATGAAAPEKTDIVCDKCGKMMVKRSGQFGLFLACSGFPNCKNTKKVS